jgi:hypothetical protein
MDRAKILKEISAKHLALANTIPEKLRKKMFLTGGTAAFLYGSGRPFSNDLDYMIQKSKIADFEKVLGMRFSYHKTKPVFHSLKAIIDISGTTYDVVAESILQPGNKGEEFIFYLTDKIAHRSCSFSTSDAVFQCIPPELLVLIKLLSGRGKELGKYDLFDVCSIVENEKLDFDFLEDLIREFCIGALPILIKNAKKAEVECQCGKMRKVIDFLELFQP